MITAMTMIGVCDWPATSNALEAALLEKMDRDIADVFLIMLDCGMRPEEVLRMRWEDVDWR